MIYYTGRVGVININKFRLYPNGFVFSDRLIKNVPSYYINKNILDRFNFSYDQNAEVSYFEENNHFIIIHGHYTYINHHKENNLLETLLKQFQNSYESFLDTLDYIGGRYVVVIGNESKVEVYPDATSSRTTYYSEDSILASSHANLLNDIEEHKLYKFGEQASLLTYHWNTTPYEDVKSISPNFKIDLISKKRERFFPRETNKYNSFSHKSKLELMEKLWKKQVEYYCEKYENIIFSITGGADSRVSLAMAREHLDKMKFFTYSTTEGESHSSKYTSVLSNDQYIVKQILKDVKLNHEFFYFDKNKFSLTLEQKEILNKNALKPHGRFLINFYLESFPQFKVMHMRGTPLEIGQAYFLARDRENTIDEIKSTFKHNMKKYEKEITEKDIDSIFENGMKNFGYDKNLFDYHVLDLYYWENRMGRWHSEILNENDVCFETVMPFNMRAMIDISLSYSRIQRRSGYLFEELINKNFPILNFYGKNEKKNLYEQQKGKENNVFVNKFSIYKKDKFIKEVQTSENKLFIPMEYLKTNYSVQTSIVFKDERGVLDISYLNKYFNSKAEGYITFEIFINHNLVASDDITQWNLESNIKLFNLKQDDKITFVLRPLKDIAKKSWENASTLFITSVEEISTNKMSPKTVLSTNPFTTIHKN